MTPRIKLSVGFLSALDWFFSFQKRCLEYAYTKSQEDCSDIWQWYFSVQGCPYITSLCEIPQMHSFSLLAHSHLWSLCTLFYLLSDQTKVEQHKLLCILYLSLWGAVGAARRWIGQGEPECFLIAAGHSPERSD